MKPPQDGDDRLLVVVLGVELHGRHGIECVRHLVVESLDRQFGVADDGVVGFVDLVDLDRVDVDVDQGLAVEQALAEIEGRVLGERVAMARMTSASRKVSQALL